MKQAMKNRIWKKPAVAWSLVGVIWIAALVLVALPSWRTALQHHHEVQDLEKGLAELDAWTVAGKWLERGLPTRAAATEQAWHKIFPVGRKREELFLDLAGVADASGVGNFKLQEMRSDHPAAFLVSPPQESVFGGSVHGVPVVVPQVTLDTYRVKASFDGDYQQTADFLGGIQGINRALSVHNLVVQPHGSGIRVDLELDVYVSQQS